MAPTFHHVLTTSLSQSESLSMNMPEPKHIEIPAFEHIPRAVMHPQHPMTETRFYNHTEIYTLLALTTLLIILLCLARIWNEFRNSYNYQELRSSVSDGELKCEGNGDGSDKLRGRLREMELERKRDEEEELERMKPLLRGACGRSGRRSGGVGGGYCTIVEVEEEDEDLEVGGSV